MSRYLGVSALALCLLVAGVIGALAPRSSEPLSLWERAWVRGIKPSPQLVDGHLQLPLTFEANVGQTDPRVKFLARTQDATVFLTADGAVFSLKGSPAADGERPPLGWKMRWVGADPDAPPAGTGEISAKSYYFMGGGSSRTPTEACNYRQVRYANLYPGIDLIYRGDHRHLEYELRASPGANLGAARLAFDGVDGLSLDDGGELRIRVGGLEARHRPPRVYQQVDGETRDVPASYVIHANDEIGFRLGAYDVNRPLIIDPTLMFSSYLGGSGEDLALGIAVDSSGFVYVTGRTSSVDFPSMNGFRSSNAGNFDVFVAKLDLSRSSPVYSTYIGGTGFDSGNSIAVDSLGNAYVVGETNSSDFPVMNAYQSSRGGSLDAFVLKLNAAGSALLYSTYLGGSGDDRGEAIAVDTAGNSYVAGSTISTNFPTVAPFQAQNAGAGDAFVTKLSPSGSTLVYSTYLGGGDFDFATGIAVDASGSAYVVGETASTNFKTANPLQGANAGFSDAFVTKLTASGSDLVYSTYLGGRRRDGAGGVAVDGSGNAYVTGLTRSPDFPLTGSLQSAKRGHANAFVTKLNATGSAAVYSTYLGGNREDGGNAIAVDSAGNAYVAGFAASINFPSVNPIQATRAGLSDAFVTKLDPNGAAMVYSTYLGSRAESEAFNVAVDSTGNAYVVGATRSTGFPTASPLQSSNLGRVNGFVVKIVDTPALALARLSTHVGSTAGGTSVRITGTNFAPGATVSFGGVAAANVTVVSPTAIDAVTPAHDEGTVDVQVKNTSGLTGTFAHSFAFVKNRRDHGCQTMPESAGPWVALGALHLLWLRRRTRNA